MAEPSFILLHLFLLNSKIYVPKGVMNLVVISVYYRLLEVGLGGFVVVCLFLAGFPYVPLSVLKLTGTSADLNLSEISQPLASRDGACWD